MKQIKIKLSNTQFDFINCPKKFKFFTGGYKSGKTFILSHQAIKYLIELKEDGLLSEPNYRMIQDILRPALENVFKIYQIPYTFKGGDWNSYITPYGKILLRTLEKRSALEGHNIGWFGIDEIDLLNYEKAKENWNVLISKLTKGKEQYGFGVGTNEGFQFIYYEFYKNSKKIKNKNIYVKDNSALFISSTRENKKNLPNNFIETLENIYDDLLIKRYIEGEFINLQNNNVYYAFNRMKHIKSINLNFNLPICITYDFNVNPMTASIFQSDNNVIYVYDVLTLKNSNTEQLTLKFCDLYADKFNICYVFGDAAGHQRNTKGLVAATDYTIIKNILNKYFNIVKFFIPDANPPVKDRINAVNSAFNKNRCFINNTPNCLSLIEDLELRNWNDIDNGHWSSNLGYAIEKIMPVRRENIQLSCFVSLSEPKQSLFKDINNIFYG